MVTMKKKKYKGEREEEAQSPAVPSSLAQPQQKNEKMSGWHFCSRNGFWELN